METERLGDGGPLVITIPRAPEVPRRFYRLALDPAPPVPDDFALIPAGWFEMGDSFDEGWPDELPAHPVYVSDFYMGRYEVTI